MSHRRRLGQLTACALMGGACLALASCKDSSAPSGTAPAPAARAVSFKEPRKPDGPVSIQIITNNSSSFWEAMAKGMKDVEPTLPGCTVKWQAPPGAQPTNNDQKAVFEQAVAANADGIAITPIEAEAFKPVIDGAIEKKIPVITYDSDASKSDRLVYLGTNNYEAGKRAGEQAIRLLPNGGSYVTFVGNMSAQNARDRYAGFEAAIKGHNITPLQDPFQDKADKTGAAYRNVADAITKYGDKINLFLGLWSYNGPAIVDEVKKANIRSKVKIVCFDGDPKTLANLKSGDVDAAVIQKPYEFGRLSTMLLYLINRKGLDEALKELKPELDKLGMTMDGRLIDTGVEVVTPANADPFLKKLKEKGLETT